LGKKSRSLRSHVTLSQPLVSSNVEFRTDPRTGEAEIFDNDVKVTPAWSALEVSYKRTSGKDKTTVLVPNTGGKILTKIDQVIESFDLLMFVDTNYKTVGIHTICVTSAVYFEVQKTSEGKAGRIVEFGGFLDEFWAPKEDPEKLGWWDVIRNIPHGIDGWSPAMKIGIVVDSHMDTLADIGTRTIPLIGDLPLLEGVTLIYASTDSQNDTIFNRMLHEADRRAKILLAHIIANPRPAIYGVSSDPWSGYRRWPSAEVYRLFNVTPPSERSRLIRIP
jgi:hypothetical protein